MDAYASSPLQPCQTDVLREGIERSYRCSRLREVGSYVGQKEWRISFLRKSASDMAGRRKYFELSGERKVRGAGQSCSSMCLMCAGKGRQTVVIPNKCTKCTMMDKIVTVDAHFKPHTNEDTVKIPKFTYKSLEVG